MGHLLVACTSQAVPWTWHEDGTEIGSYNTQQHFATIGDRLYLVYTRRGVNNDHVFRHRAPLFIAEVSLDGFTPTLIRESEQIAVPERGARLGNFGVTNVSEREAWVVACEWMQSWRGGGEPGWSDCEAHGANNAIWLSRIELPGSKKEYTCDHERLSELTEHSKICDALRAPAMMRV